MKAYKGVFKKKNGEIREMSFVRLPDIDKYNSDFLAERITGDSFPKRYGDGMELVFDLENDNFRIFNWNTAISDVETYIVDDNLFA